MTVLDERAVTRLSPASFTRLLDAGCGTGRRIRGIPRAARVPGAAVGIDLVPEMLAQGQDLRGGLAAGDLLRLPLTAEAFDLVWCRLAVGHVAGLSRFYGELARVLTPTGTLLVTDVHPEAAGAGHRRTFRTRDGALHEVIHHVHTIAAHHAAAGHHGLVVEEAIELGVGEEIRRFYEEAGDLARYERDLGRPMLLALRLRPIIGAR
ncbi:MAG: class I SAM-dependent methyltransferase [Acidobacteria bacterium]|nr:class I SAM-dependent methyltransferase [Acidobacteriota bacterium]